MTKNDGRWTSHNIEVVRSVDDLNHKNPAKFGVTYTPLKNTEEVNSFVKAHFSYFNKIECKEANIEKEYFYLFLNKYPKLRKDVLKEGYYTYRYNLKKDYQSILNHISKDGKEILKNVSLFTISNWTVDLIDLNEVDTYLVSKGAAEQDLFSFWIDFLKSRKNQIKQPQSAPKIAKFLENKFSEQKLESFFPFFDYLHNQYHDVEPDIYDKEYNFTTDILINLKKIAQFFAINNFDSNDYYQASSSFMKAFKKEYEIEDAWINELNPQKKTYGLSFHHNKPTFTKDLLKKRFTQYFKEIKLNPNAYEQSKDEFALKWLQALNLRESLSNQSESIKKKTNKI